MLLLIVIYIVLLVDEGDGVGPQEGVYLKFAQPGVSMHVVLIALDIMVL